MRYDTLFFCSFDDGDAEGTILVSVLDGEVIEDFEEGRAFVPTASGSRDCISDIVT